jgi:putative phosphoesterase
VLAGVLSDSHDNLPKLEAAVEVLRAAGAEHLVHAGDFVAPFAVKILAGGGIPFTGVFGNNDGEKAGIRRISPNVHEPPHAFELGGRHIVAVHDLAKLPDEARDGAEIVIFGHTHKSLVEAGPPLLLNPGEVGGWLERRSTVGLLDLDSLEVSILDV